MAFGALGIAGRRQIFLSDGQGDPYARYVMQSLPVSLTVGAAFRLPIPLVFDVRVSYFGSQLSVPVQSLDGTSTQVGIFESGVLFNTHAGYRVYSADAADLDLGLGGGVDLFFNPGVANPADPADTLPVIAAGLFANLRPMLRATLRPGGGQFGYLVTEAALVAGVYLPNPSPQERLNAQAGNIEGEVASEPKPPGLGLAGEFPAANPTPPGMGMDGRVTYHFPVTPQLTVLCDLGLVYRMADLAGPGYRTSYYLRASDVEMVSSFGVGAAFAF
jgi:hypothetical protein